ncbi:hypothetical protein YC2023_065981 [Brassica napus]
MTGLDGLNWTELPRHNRKESTIGRNWPSRRHQPISFRLVAARVSLRMAPDACTPTPRAPHGWLHVQDTCRTPPLLPDVRLHDWSSCKAPHILTHVDHHASVACVATSRAWPIHLMLHMACCMSRTHEGRRNSSQMSGCMTGTHARLHGLLPCTATPQASVDTQLAGQLTPRSELMQRATSSFSVHWPDFGPSGRPWQSVCVRVYPSAHTGRMWLSISTHISTLVLGLSTLALPVDCSGDFGPRGLSVQYTQDVRGCPSAHTGRPWVSVSTHRTSVGVRQHTQDVRGCPCLSVSTHRTSVAVHQYTYQHVGPWTQHADPSVDCSGDLSPRGLSVQYTQDVRWCLPAHTGRPWLSACVRMCPSAHTGRLWLSISTHISTLYTQDVRGCPSAHTGRPCVSVSTHRTSVAVRVCPSAHTGRLWLSISTHISTLVLGLSTLTLLVECSGDFGPRWLSVQYTQEIRGCPPAHTGRPWLSVCFRQHTQDVCGCPSVHISARWSLD